ncbi:MAG: hypothetical protein KKD17_05785 [Nanoarchaeota archaeon]|nr:hypothetical protein [Nanoarchaeota archaeon]
MSLEKELVTRKTAEKEIAEMKERAQDALFLGLSSFLINEQRIISERTRPRKIKNSLAEHIQSALPQEYFTRSQQAAIENAGFEIWQGHLAMSDEERAMLSTSPTHSLKDRVAEAVQEYFQRGQAAEHPSRAYSRLMSEINGEAQPRPFWQRMASAAATVALVAALCATGCRANVTDYSDGGSYSHPLPTMNMPVDAGTVYGSPDADADEPLTGGISGDIPEDMPLPATAIDTEGQPLFEDIFGEDYSLLQPPEQPDECAADSGTETGTGTTPATEPASCLTELVIPFAYNSPNVSPEHQEAIRSFVRQAHADGTGTIYVATFRSMESRDDGNSPQLDDDDYNLRLGWQTADAVAELATAENNALGGNAQVLKTTYGEGASQGPGLAENRIAVLSTQPLPDLDQDAAAAARIRGYARGAISSDCGGTPPGTASAPEETPAAAASTPAPTAPAQDAPAQAEAPAPAHTTHVPSHAPSAHAPAHAPAHPAAPAHAPHHPAVTPSTHLGPAAPANLGTAPDGHPIITAPNGAVIHYGTLGQPSGGFVESGPVYVSPEGTGTEGTAPAPAVEPETPAPAVEPAAPAAEPEAVVPSPASPADEEPLVGETVPASIVERTSALEDFVEHATGQLHSLYTFMDLIENECTTGGSGNTLCAIAEEENYVNRCGEDGSPKIASGPGETPVCEEALRYANADFENTMLDIDLIVTNYHGLIQQLESAGINPANVAGLQELGDAIHSLEEAVDSDSGSDTTSSNSYAPSGNRYASLLAEYVSTSPERRTVADLRSEGLDEALALAPGLRGARSTLDAAHREARRADAYTLYTSGTAVRDIAAEHDVSTSTVYRDIRTYSETHRA